MCSTSRPVIGIYSTWSEPHPVQCRPARHRADFVKRGVWEQAACRWSFPVMSLGRYQMEAPQRCCSPIFWPWRPRRPSAPIRSTPWCCLAAASRPPRATWCGRCRSAHHRGLHRINARQVSPVAISAPVPMFGSSARRYAQAVSMREFLSAESGMSSRSPGTCMTMGTASSMASMKIEAVGLTLPYNATIPAVDSRRRVLYRKAGDDLVMAREDRRLSRDPYACLS